MEAIVGPEPAARGSAGARPGGGQSGGQSGGWEFVGGHIALDFVNTVDDRTGSHLVELLAAPADLAAWGVQAGILGEPPDQEAADQDAAGPEAPDRTALGRRRAAGSESAAESAAAAAAESGSGSAAAAAAAAAAGSESAAAAEFAAALDLRGHLTAMLDDRQAGRRIKTADLRVLAEAVSAGFAAGMLSETERGLLTWHWNPLSLATIRHVVAVEAADLLSGPAASRIRGCAGDGCGWYFLDTTKRNNRRWCTMRDCGQDAKTARRRAARASAAPAR